MGLKEQAQHCLYQRIQNTAAALTQVYQGQVEEGRDWQPFQTAAGSLTLLYKDSLEELRKAAEINRKLGHQRTRVDVATWAKSKRRFIRREELLAFLAEDSPGQGEGEGLDRLSLSNPRRAPVVLPSLQDMLDLSRLSPGHRKRSSPHLPSKTKRWNILPSPKDPEKIELSSSSFFPVSLCSHSGKMSYYIFLPRLAKSEIWAKLTSKTCQRYCARPL